MEDIRKGMMDHPIPDCKPDGTYKEVQCNGMTGCWCVTSEGKKIKGTYVAQPKRPNCGSNFIPGKEVFFFSSYNAIKFLIKCVVKEVVARECR